MKKPEEASGLTWQQQVWQGLTTLGGSLGALALYLVIPALLMCVGMIFQKGRDGASMADLSGNFYYTLGILTTFWILWRRSKKRGSILWEETTLFFRERSDRRLLLLFGTGFGCSLLFSGILTLVPFPAVLMDGYVSAADGVEAGTDLFLAFLSTMALAPVMEEIVFRGYMLGGLLKGFEEQRAILISAGIFALCHISFLWMIYAFLMGIFLARVSVREDNILYSVALHMGFNATVLPLWVLNRSGIFESAWVGPACKLAVGLGGYLLASRLYGRYRKEELCD